MQTLLSQSGGDGVKGAFSSRILRQTKGIYSFLSPVFLAHFFCFAFVLSHTGLALVHIQSNSCIC